MKPRKTRQGAQAPSRVAPRRAPAVAEPRVAGLERDGEIRLTQLLRALAGEADAKSAH